MSSGRVSEISSCSALGLFGFVAALFLNTAHTSAGTGTPSSHWGGESHPLPAAEVASSSQTRARLWPHSFQGTTGLLLMTKSSACRSHTATLLLRDTTPTTQSQLIPWHEPCSHTPYLTITGSWGPLIPCLLKSTSVSYSECLAFQWLLKTSEKVILRI